MTSLLIQLQLSNYTSDGTEILECDSGYNMMSGRARVMSQLNPNLKIDILGAERSRLATQPEDIHPDVFNNPNIRYIETHIEANALQTRYDFDFNRVASDIDVKNSDYDVVYVNDPMLLRHFKAMFFLRSKKAMPRFVCHSHFVDCPAKPKFPIEASLWMGQLEAAHKADYNFWQCKSALDEFENEARKWLVSDKVDDIMKKSSPYDDGYSSTEINVAPNMGNIRFDTNNILKAIEGKHVIFVPNRVGGLGRSSDYTQCGKFLFEIIPELWKVRQDFVVIAGNPSQKILNHEIVERCPALFNIVPDALNRDEYRMIVNHCDFSVGTYGGSSGDTYGGTASRECLDLGTLPLWVDCNEYASIAREVGWDTDFLMPQDLAMPDTIDAINRTLNWYDERIPWENDIADWRQKFKNAVRTRCSYENTTKEAMQIMGLL